MNKTVRASFPLAVTIFLSLVVMPVHAQSPTECPRAQAILDIQRAAGNDSLIEPVHFNRGLAVIINAMAENAVGTLHQAADAYTRARAKYVASKPTKPCEPVWSGVVARKLTEEIQKTSKGILVVYISNSPSVVKQIQASDCCNWCVCKGQDTVNSCTKCCG